MKHFICLCFAIMLLSCGKKYDCAKESLMPAYVGYSIDEADTIILKRFRPGSNFSQLVDSILLTQENCFITLLPDTHQIQARDMKNRLSNEFDFQLINPTDQKTVSISEMKFETRQYKSGGLFAMDPPACFSPLITYKQDGTVVNPSQNTGNKYLYIHK